MKKITTKALLFSAATLVAFSCQEVAETPNVEVDGAISCKSTINTGTKATDITFENGDAISVTAFSEGAVYADNVNYTFDNGVFTSTSPIVENGELSFVAIYPALTTPYDNEFTVGTYADQTGSNYTLSDLMTSTTEATSSLTPELSFYHNLSRLVLTVTSDVDLTNAVVAVPNVYTSVDANISEGTFVANETGAQEDVVMNTVTVGGSYQAIIVPQAIAAGTDLIEITVNGKVYAATLESKATFVSGKQYFVEMVIENNEVTFITSIVGWEEGDLFGDDEEEGGEVETATFTTDEFIAIYENWSEGGEGPEAITANTWIFTDEAISSDYNTQAIMYFAECCEEGREISLEFPNLTTGTSTLFNALGYTSTKVVSISLPLLINSTTYMFQECDGLKSVSMPSLQNLNQHTFYKCNGLEELTLCLNNATTNASSYFFNSTSVANVDLYTGSEANTSNCIVVDGTTWKVMGVVTYTSFTGFKSITVVE